MQKNLVEPSIVTSFPRKSISTGAQEEAFPVNKEHQTMLAQALLSEWQLVHGASNGKASTLIGVNSLSILIENAFSEAENVLAQQAEDISLLQAYVESLVDQISPTVVAQVEKLTGRCVEVTSVGSNVKQGWVFAWFKLVEPLPSER